MLQNFFYVKNNLSFDNNKTTVEEDPKSKFINSSSLIKNVFKELDKPENANKLKYSIDEDNFIGYNEEKK
jgi:hypothetical protein